MCVINSHASCQSDVYVVYPVKVFGKGISFYLKHIREWLALAIQGGPPCTYNIMNLNEIPAFTQIFQKNFSMSQRW